MGKGKRLSSEEIGKIKALKEEGYSNRHIARKLSRSVNVINNFVRDPENYGKRQKGGIKTATTERERRLILREASNSTLSASHIARKVGVTCSVRTVRRVIKASPTIKRLRLKKKPALTAENQASRLLFAERHSDWTIDEWSEIIFTDEKRFCGDGPDGFSYYYHDLRKEPKYLSRHHSRSGSVMVWGAISYRGPVDLVVIEERMTGNNYMELLQRELPMINEVMQGAPWILQQDNAPIHTARQVTQYLDSENIRRLEWPANSPDLNIIENLWGWLTRKIYENGKQYQSTIDLEDAIRTAWNEILIQMIQKLYLPLPKRMLLVRNNNGKSIRY